MERAQDGLRIVLGRIDIKCDQHSTISDRRKLYVSFSVDRICLPDGNMVMCDGTSGPWAHISLLDIPRTRRDGATLHMSQLSSRFEDRGNRLAGRDYDLEATHHSGSEDYQCWYIDERGALHAALATCVGQSMANIEGWRRRRQYHVSLDSMLRHL